MVQATNDTRPPGPAAYLGRDLVFVISQPRAGSTLLQRMLAGHPDIQTSAETWLMLHPAWGLKKSGVSAPYGAHWAAMAVREFLDNYAGGEETYREGVRAFARAVYGAVLEKHGKRLFLDKTPRYTMIVPELKAWFPEARFVLLIRNPLAVLASELETYIREDWPMLARFAPDLVDAPRRLVEARDLLGEQAIEVRYENLVADPGGEMGRICAHLGIDVRPEMIDYSSTPAPVGRMNDPVGVHRHQRPSTESLEKWRALGRDSQHRHLALASLDALGADVLGELGYDPAALREAILAEPQTVWRGSVFPWRLAMKPAGRWSLRDQLVAAWHLGRQSGGTLAGLGRPAGVLWGRLRGGVKRTAGGHD